MLQSSHIIIKTTTGYSGIWCSYPGTMDDLLPSVLVKHYATPERAAALVALGHVEVVGRHLAPPSPDISAQETMSCTVAYHRDYDGNLEICHAATLDAVFDALDDDAGNATTAYVFDGEEWMFFMRRRCICPVRELRSSS